MSAFFSKIAAFFIAVLMFFGIIKPAQDYTKYSNVSYGSGSSCKMDIFVPSSLKDGDSVNLLLYVHGGGWTGGDKGEGADVCITAARNNILSVTMNYTLHTDKNKATAYDMLDEIDMCLKEIKSLAESKNITVKKAALMGFSAGAHLTSLYAYSRAETSPVPIAFIVEKSGPYDFHGEYWEGSDYATDMDYVVGQLSGTAVTEENREKLTNSLSPLCYVNENSVPSIIAYGGKDALVNEKNSIELVSRLKACNVPCVAIRFPDSGHGLDGDDKHTQEFYNAFVAYADTYFD